MLVDVARVHVLGGDGGRGCSSFRREKFVPKGGPNGGDGGQGGDVWFEVDPHVRTLLDCRERPRYGAQHGRAGSGNNRTGADGDDLVVRLPPGTVVKNVEGGEVLADLVRPGDRVRVARGGHGGRGNARFATPTHQAPRRADPGEKGEERWLELELKLIADVGIVGLPNAGKSTLLSRVTRAHPRIAAYPFTTLEPNLGIVALDEERQFVAADVPGLIEGAHEGRGLGIQFLRHLERTRMLLLLVDVTGESPSREAAVVLNELTSYSEALAAKPRVTVLTKADLLPEDAHADAPRRAGLPEAALVSAHTGLGMRALMESLWALLPKVPVEPVEDAAHDG